MIKQTKKHSMKISDILSSGKTGHGLELFDKNEINKLENEIFEKREKPYIKCFVSGVDRPLTPEEIVRQLFARQLVYHYGYQKERLAVEEGVTFGSTMASKRADIIVRHKNNPEPYMIAEVKKPERKDGEEQLKSYCNAKGSPIGIWTNGKEMEIWHLQKPNNFVHIPSVPMVDQTLDQVVKEEWTLEKLTKENKLLTEKKSLRDIIVRLEDLVLANSGEDSFEEVFKLIYTKLYDEYAATNIPSRKNRIYFRRYGENQQELYEKINTMFYEAKQKWRDVFSEHDEIQLTPSHLETCVSFLEDIKLFNSNLYVIDEAFEYLVTQVAKGDKGQYFTPRHAIDMCVKMLNPKVNEYVIDPAAGSCGFTVHTIFHISGQPFTNQKLPPHALEFAQNNVFGIDFDFRAIKVAKALNLIAGDGKTNVYKANSLDNDKWANDIKSALKKFLKHFPNDRKIEEENRRAYKYFDFDVLLTNPPFAGDIQEPQILNEYLLAKRKDGKIKPTVERDTLFIEKAFNFLKNGGRMAIVLPQGKFNNTNEQHIREFILERGRILAVVSLGVNTFKPHTGTKTSILFVQKWDDKLCPRVDDYPIFFANSQSSGKDNSGEYKLLKDENGNAILDDHGHPKILHDLDEIADQFVSFAKKQKLSFWRD